MSLYKLEKMLEKATTLSRLTKSHYRAVENLGRALAGAHGKGLHWKGRPKNRGPNTGPAGAHLKIKKRHISISINNEINNEIALSHCQQE